MEKQGVSFPLLAEVASALGELKDQFVFVGGAVVGLYADSLDHVEEGEGLRVTMDIDLTVNLVNYGDWALLQEKLALRKFYPDSSSSVICRFRYGPIQVDIMPIITTGIGESNKWYKIGMGTRKIIQVLGQEIQVFSAPCFLATKFEAFLNRGSDLRISHDIEDIVYILDKRSEIVNEIKNDHPEIKEFLQTAFKNWEAIGITEEVLLSNLFPRTVSNRLAIVHGRIREILAI